MVTCRIRAVIPRWSNPIPISKRPPLVTGKPASAMIVSTPGVTTATIKTTVAAAKRWKSRPWAPMLSAVKESSDRPERVIPRIAVDIHPATTFTEAIPMGQFCRVSTNMPRYWIARRIMFQRQSRTKSKPAEVITIRITAVQANVSSMAQGFLCAKKETKSTRTSSVHMTPLSPSSTLEIMLLNRPNCR